MERALPNPEVKSRLSAIAIGLAADCDAPDGGIDELMHQGLPGATGLPFVAILTPDGQWIDGFSGYRDAKELASFLDRAAKSPLLEAPAAVRKQLEKLATAATAAAARADWKPVLAAAREADKSHGRCPERTAIKAAEQKAREWLAAQYDAVFQAAATGADLAPARQRLADVKRHFAGEPEALDADTGTKALQRLKYVREIEANPNPARDLRERSAAMFPGTRWTALFEKPTAPAGGQEKAPAKAPD